MIEILCESKVQSCTGMVPIRTSILIKVGDFSLKEETKKKKNLFKKVS